MSGLTGQYPGPEAAARQARYAALDQAAGGRGECIMLGHTLDDQAETVLLGLARGSGARSLAGMAPQSGRYLRPLLGLRRARDRRRLRGPRAAALGRPAQHRPRLQQGPGPLQLLPGAEAALGPGVAAALARTAGMLRADAEFLDALARRRHGPGRARRPDARPTRGAAAGWRLPTRVAAAAAGAIRHRLLRSARAGGRHARAGALSQRHVASIDEL